jgi:hypothetical protein
VVCFTSLSMSSPYRVDWNWEDLEVSIRDLLKVLSWQVPGGTEEDHEDPQGCRSVALPLR